jgi:hypothetical protein
MQAAFFGDVSKTLAVTGCRGYACLPATRSSLPEAPFSSGGLTALFGHAPASERSNFA